MRSAQAAKGVRSERCARVSSGQKWAGKGTKGHGSGRSMEVEFELTCGANARLLGRGCARGMVGKDALRSVRLDGRGTASRPAHGETKYQGIRAGAENREDCVSSNRTICSQIQDICGWVRTMQWFEFNSRLNGPKSTSH